MEPRFFIEFTGYSMHPFLRPGDRLLVRRVEPDTLEPGDVVVVENGPGSLVAHRLIGLLPDGRGITKGDSLLTHDPGPVDLRAVRGKVEGLVRDGRFVPVASGFRERFKSLFARLSRRGLTPGALRLRAKHIVEGVLSRGGPSGSENETRYILDVLAERLDRPPQHLDWELVVMLARKEQVAGLLYCHLTPKDAPKFVLEDLARFHHSTAAANMARIEALKELDGELARADIDALALKGASLLAEVYPKAGMRPMGDLDLVVRPRDEHRFEALLLGLGYEPDPVHPHLFTRSKVVVDLHTHALDIARIRARRGLFPAGMGPVWEEALPVMPGFARVMRPSDRDNVLLLSQHLLKHSFSKLFWLADIFRLLQGRSVGFWAGLEARARELGQAKPLAYNLYLLERLFGLEMPEVSGLGRFEKNILDIRARGEEFGLLGNLLLLLCLSTWRERLAFGLETALPKGNVVARDLGAAGEATPGSYVTRFFNVGRYLAKSGLILLRGYRRRG